MKRLSRIKTTAISATMIFGLSTPAMAVDQGITFTGLITEQCAVLLGVPGTLGVSPDQTILSSEESGGNAGTAIVTTNGLGSNIQVVVPTSFAIGPASADDNVTFAGDYDLSGSTILSDIVGSTTSALSLGVTTISVHASATKTTGTFEAGTYQMVPIVRCLSS
ncbi:hypothetical protein GCM10011309_23660 [Litorimonas cladophorae]|uniref:Uncharacterized protein n=1 Tax=Litorimonas cladophorae TaxID=1220491 RepID=A0A918KR42_9PROT|nr:hypothetical protein [Litorimonas cladophorae]GGX72572.1 hypothetical protein GCM10011309_23660 [Litorimonas cladophorae]